MKSNVFHRLALTALALALCRVSQAAQDDGIWVAGTIKLHTETVGEVTFASVPVYAFPIEALGAFSAGGDTIKLPKPLTWRPSDQHGKFKMKVPGQGPFFIFAQARLLERPINGDFEPHYYRWIVKLSDMASPADLKLGNSNLVNFTYQQVVIAH